MIDLKVLSLHRIRIRTPKMFVPDPNVINSDPQHWLGEKEGFSRRQDSCSAQLCEKDHQSIYGKCTGTTTTGKRFYSLVSFHTLYAGCPCSWNWTRWDPDENRRRALLEYVGWERNKQEEKRMRRGWEQDGSSMRIEWEQEENKMRTER